MAPLREPLLPSRRPHLVLAGGRRLRVAAPLGPVLLRLAAVEAAAEAPQDEVEPPAAGDRVGPVAVVAAVQDGPARRVLDHERLARQRLRLLAQAAADALEEQRAAGKLL